MIEQLKLHITDEYLQKKFENIKHHYIESEHPDHHWNYLEVNNEIVADLGCGFHLMEPTWDTTPSYFLKKGAKQIIGVDPECKDIEYFKNMYPESHFFCDSINTVEKINSYINDYHVTSLKMDIEGFENLFLESTNKFEKLKYVAIETHSKDLLAKFLYKLDSLDFKIDIVCTFYPRVFNICNLIYAHR